MSNELKAYYVVPSNETENYINGEMNLAFEAYDADDVDAILAEKDKEIAELKARIQLDDDEMAGFLQLEEECGGGDLRNYIAELKQKLDKAIAERDGNQACIDALNEKLGAMNEFIKASKELLKESQKMHQRCADNASKQIRRLNRALYKACANWALSTLAWLDCIDQGEPRKWSEMVQKCRAKAEEYK